MNIFFDMDQTLIAYNGLLRPFVAKVLDQLNLDNHTIFIWSGVGVRTDEVRQLGILSKVKGVYAKPLDRFEQGLIDLKIPVRPDAVIDDHEEIVSHFGGVLVKPYFWPDSDDKEMNRVYIKLTEMFKSRSNQNTINN